jgi:hypothetical protein
LRYHNINFFLSIEKTKSPILESQNASINFVFLVLLISCKSFVSESVPALGKIFYNKYAVKYSVESREFGLFDYPSLPKTRIRSGVINRSENYSIPPGKYIFPHRAR